MKKDERLFFIGAALGKYLEYYGSRNNYTLDEDKLNEDVIPALEGELTDWFKQPPLTEDEINHIIHYMHTIEDRMFEIDKKERERVK